MAPLEASGADGAHLLADAARPFSLRGVALAALAAAPTLLAPLGPAASWALVAGAATAVVHLLAVTHVARGRGGFLVPERNARRAPPIAVAGRGFALYVLAALPFAAAVAFGPAAPPPTAADVLVAMLATSLYLPAAIGAVVASGHAATAFWPFAWMRVIGTIGPVAYGRACLVFAAGVLGAWALDQGAGQAAARLGPSGLTEGYAALAYASVSGFARTTLTNLAWFAQACAIGALFRRERAGLGI